MPSGYRRGSGRDRALAAGDLALSAAPQYQTSSEPDSDQGSDWQLIELPSDLPTPTPAHNLYTPTPLTCCVLLALIVYNIYQYVFQ